MNQMLESERLEHNEIYDQQKNWLLEEALTWDRYYQRMCKPPHLGGTLYGLDHKILLDFLVETLQNYDPAQTRILDYGCGTGALAIALASKGYQVSGFDLSDKGIEIAQLAAQKAGVSNSTDFYTANAQQLPFENQQFDLVIGKAVLHHTIKYEGTEQELYRILKPGAKVIFFEGAASNPFISLARKFTLKEEFGDVPLTVKKVHHFARNFQKVNIRGYFFLYMFKRLGYYSSDESLADLGKNKLGRSFLFRWMLRLCLFFDRLFINEKVSETAGRYLIDLEK